MTPRALIFDVDGTLAETEEIHRAAFNEAFAEAGLDWHWSEALYARLLLVTGGRERITAYAAETGAGGIDVAALHGRKTAIFNVMLRRGGVALRPGIERLIRLGREAGLAVAIATTTSRPNVISLIETTIGAEALGWFASLRTGEDVSAKKPDPEVYRLVLADLGMCGGDCLAFEDSANGLRAARAAGIPTVITPSLYSRGEDFSGGHVLADGLCALPHAAAPPDLLSRLHAQARSATPLACGGSLATL